MSGFCYGEPEPQEACPYCAQACSADYVDIGVGMQQCGPFHCQACGASEIGSFDKERERSEQEKKTGWYEPGQPPGSSANVIGGQVVGYREMRDHYHAAFAGNPDWDDDAKVAEWWLQTRQPDIVQ